MQGGCQEPDGGTPGASLKLDAKDLCAFMPVRDIFCGLGFFGESGRKDP